MSFVSIILTVSRKIKQNSTEKIRSLETSQKTTCILADLPGPKLRLGEFNGVKLLNNGDTIRLLCGVLKHDGDEIPLEYEGLSAELKSGDKILLG